jgi:hypothetical protein
MNRFFTLLAFLAALTLPARAQSEEIVAGLSQNVVSITATFVGSEILIFGAVRFRHCRCRSARRQYRRLAHQATACA